MVFKKKVKKVNIFKTMLVNLLKVLGIGDPPPFWEKFPNNPVFFMEASLSENEAQLCSVKTSIILFERCC